MKAENTINGRFYKVDIRWSDIPKKWADEFGMEEGGSWTWTETKVFASDREHAADIAFRTAVHCFDANWDTKEDGLLPFWFYTEQARIEAIVQQNDGQTIGGDSVVVISEGWTEEEMEEHLKECE